MASESVVYNRNVLYAQVWQTPMTRLAQTYGMSDVGLKKICRKLRVPVPGRGYWRKKEIGRSIPIPPLPKLRVGEKAEIEQERRADLPMSEPVTDDLGSALAFEKLPENRVVVPGRISSPHPLVETTLTALDRAKQDEKGRLQPVPGRCLDVRTGPDSTRRALRIMDALLRAFEARGMDVALERKGEPGTFVQVKGEWLQIHMEETTERKYNKIPASKAWDKAQNPWKYPEMISVPSGQLELRIPSLPYSGLRRVWRDTDKKKLEEQLNAFLVGLIKASAKAKTERLEHERREAERQEQARRHEAQERRRQQEKHRREALNARLEAWARGLRLRAYLQELSSRADLGNEEGSAWGSWIESQARSLESFAMSIPPSDETGLPPAPSATPR